MDEWVVEFGQSDELVARIYAGGDDAVKAIRDYATECKAYCRSLVAVAKSVQPRWIPVSERLPEDNVCVLVNHWMTGIEMAFRRDDQWGITWTGFMGSGSGYTHWMPLPEPPGAKR